MQLMTLFIRCYESLDAISDTSARNDMIPEFEINAVRGEAKDAS